MRRYMVGWGRREAGCAQRAGIPRERERDTPVGKHYFTF